MAQGTEGAKRLGAGFIAVVAFIALIVLMKAIHVVPAGHRGIVFSTFSGTKNVTLGEGLNFVTPFIDQPINYEVRTRTLVFSDLQSNEGDERAPSISAKTSKQQTVSLDLTVRYHIDPTKVHLLHQQVERQYVEKIVKPDASGDTRAVVAAYEAEEIYATKRQAIEDEIARRLRETFEPQYIILDEVLIRNVAFTDEYHRAIEQKQIALQRAQKKRYELWKEQREKERRIIEAKGQADAIDVRGYALAQYPEVVKYEYVENLPVDLPAYVTSGDTIVSLSDLLRTPAKQGE
ncbi:MAG: prohibitin family protein [Armatimonadetes bacterium]|nr:prohibitin family protein [Armatimonadota bacterium]MDI9600548.1 prohibitin family protein [Acidobacteriota bacterium]NLN88767.1 prohibitin family protein [candidate division WS1 bacterium]